jgi:hypothetical protein
MSAVAGPEVPDQGLVARAIGVVTSPTETFRAVALAPRPAGILFLVCLALAIATAGPQFTARGRQAALDMQVRQMERFSGQPVSPEMYARLERQTQSFGLYSAVIGTFVFVPIASMVFAALYWVAFNALLGGTGTFKQVLGVVTHSQVITALGAIVSAPIQYAQDMVSPTGPFNLGVLAPMLDPNGFAAAFLSMLTVFQLWSVIVSAIGLAVLYRRPVRNIAIALLGFHLVVMAAFAGFPFLFSRS